ncbi:sensor histidine kinase [Mucilaginibacter myungsuensis]|uniref:histidine kinase n=1 Tax=Mucilaginibacter myungsuensis TaxID=649104 RepID=A0A929PVV4_9SPHI|nr:7TM diverse intracellular signaling domain-containing protein [Mucilaginibacter myungsuensis]MBE9660710.1 GHKL domain-containing protein [Mucilaginibacter myungsuensis]MDN3600755.1 7TM diverse intracellular signaling domain-containing protein [Mucilaginibacter myungsuensis]
MKKLLLLAVSLLFNLYCAYATDTLTVYDNQAIRLDKRYFTQFEDVDGNRSVNDVLFSTDFHQSRTTLPFIHYTDSVLWIKFTLRNRTSEPYLPISINSGVIDGFEIYSIGAEGGPITHLTSLTQDKQNTNGHISRVINCPILPDSVAVVYLRVRSDDSMAMPITVTSAGLYQENAQNDTLIIGFFIGMVAIMAFYNLMLFVIVKDKSYLYYVFYIVFLGATQWLTRGLGLAFISVNKVTYNAYLVPISRILLWYAILAFVQEFLQMKRNMLKKQSRYYNLLFAFITLPLIAVIFKQTTLAYSLITAAALINSVVLLYIGIRLYLKGFKPAKFFMLGWGVFFVTVLITLARNKGLIQYNDVTANVILYSSAFELVMFSIALADRINFYRKQNAESQTMALAIARENERLITNQNFLLENEVKERTQELIASNKHLSVTIEDLKAAQIKLVDTEKMASLGQLTAGIAHEINNPINFVSANVKPLRMDIQEVFELISIHEQLANDPGNTDLQRQAKDFAKKIDLDFVKTEISTLLDGIEEGASRTTEIVESLRTFSRSDQPVLKATDINRAILNTLVLLRSTIPYEIEIQPVLDKLPLLNCYPGKINQVLVNLINNGIQAIKAKPVHHNEHLIIATKDEADHICIEITDTGVGMTDEVKQHIFDPFFTTKDIGEGTGLGMSIVFGIIEQHRGTIKIKSAPDQGTTMVIKLPKDLQ